jgi:hypothetical protein
MEGACLLVDDVADALAADDPDGSVKAALHAGDVDDAYRLVALIAHATAGHINVDGRAVPVAEEP